MLKLLEAQYQMKKERMDQDHKMRLQDIKA
jgi:hypothetical protein